MSVALAHPVEVHFKRFLFYSLVLHGVLLLSLVISAVLHLTGREWSGPGGQLGSATKVNLIASSGIPMPRQPEVTDSKAIDPTKGLYKEQPKPPEPKTDATKIPKFEKEKPPPPSHPSKVFESKTPPPPNAVNYGRGGNPDIPVGTSQNPGASSGVATLGQGGGDFGARYPWYVDAVRYRIQQTWDQSTIEPGVRSARRAHTVMSFRINANGSISNIRMAQSSGNSSMDYSAQRALQSIDAFRPLPNDYMGNYVDVTFDFDLSMAH